MPDQKISADSAVTSPATTDVVPIISSGVNKKVTIANLITAAGAAIAGAIGSSSLTMSTGKILGRSTAGTGAIEELTPTGTGTPVLATSPTFVTGISSPAITDTGLTAGRVIFASTAGLLADDADLTFAVDTLTAAKFSGPTVGVATNSSAAAGQVGELIVSLVTDASAVSLTTATDANVTSISLTAGDWDVSFSTYFQTGTGTNVVKCIAGISSTSATMAFGAGQFNIVGFGASGIVQENTAWIGVNNPPFRVSLASTITYFLVARSTFTVSTNSAWGVIRARRIR